MGRLIKFRTFTKWKKKFEEDINIEITPDILMTLTENSYFIMYEGMPLLLFVSTDVAGMDIGGGIVLPSNVGYYIAYIDNSPNFSDSGSFFCVTKVFDEEIHRLDEKFLPTSVMDFLRSLGYTG